MASAAWARPAVASRRPWEQGPVELLTRSGCHRSELGSGEGSRVGRRSGRLMRLLVFAALRTEVSVLGRNNGARRAGHSKKRSS